MNERGSSRWSGEKHEHDPNVRYWSATVDPDPKNPDAPTPLQMGGTTFTPEQAKEQLLGYLESEIPWDGECRVVVELNR